MLIESCLQPLPQARFAIGTVIDILTQWEKAQSAALRSSHGWAGLAEGEEAGSGGSGNNLLVESSSAGSLAQMGLTESTTENRLVKVNGGEGKRHGSECVDERVGFGMVDEGKKKVEEKAEASRLEGKRSLDSASGEESSGVDDGLLLLVSDKNPEVMWSSLPQYVYHCRLSCMMFKSEEEERRGIAMITEDIVPVLAKLPASAYLLHNSYYSKAILLLVFSPGDGGMMPVKGSEEEKKGNQKEQIDETPLQQYTQADLMSPIGSVTPLLPNSTPTNDTGNRESGGPHASIPSRLNNSAATPPIDLSLSTGLSLQPHLTLSPVVDQSVLTSFQKYENYWSFFHFILSVLSVFLLFNLA